MSAGELPLVLQVVQRWLRAVYVEHDTAAALALMHPSAPLPAADVGQHIRARYPWLFDWDVSFQEPIPIAPDLDKIDVFRGEQPAVRILVLRRLRPARGGPEQPLVFALTTPRGWTGGEA